MLYFNNWLAVTSQQPNHKITLLFALRYNFNHLTSSKRLFCSTVRCFLQQRTTFDGHSLSQKYLFDTHTNSMIFMKTCANINFRALPFKNRQRHIITLKIQSSTKSSLTHFIISLFYLENDFKSFSYILLSLYDCSIILNAACFLI